MKKKKPKKIILTTTLIHSAVLTSLLVVVGPLDVIANGVAPVNPLNPAVTIQPTSPPPDTFSKPEKESNTPQTTTSSPSTNSKSKVPKQLPKKVTDAHIKMKKKKPSKLRNVNELSSYPLSNEGAVLEQRLQISGGSVDFTKKTTQVGQTLAKLSGVLIYGKKYTA